jgi:hypothetical protein
LAGRQREAVIKGLFNQSSLRSVSFGSGEGLVVGDMCSGEPPPPATAAAAAAVIKFNVTAMASNT